MRLSVLSLAVVVLWGGIAYAKYPDPANSSVAVTGQGGACQFRFRADGGLDQMTVSIIVRDGFGLPVSCSTSATLEPDPATLALCTCGPVSQAADTDTSGAVQLVFDRIGGRGSLDVCVTALFSGARIGLARVPIDFTGPDLDGSCPPDPASAVDVIDLGIWASGLPPGYTEPSDYDCNGAVDVLDLAIWAGGLGLGCGP